MKETEKEIQLRLMPIIFNMQKVNKNTVNPNSLLNLSNFPSIDTKKELLRGK